MAVPLPVSSPPSVACQVEPHSFAAPAVIQGGVEEEGGGGVDAEKLRRRV